MFTLFIFSSSFFNFIIYFFRFFIFFAYFYLYFISWRKSASTLSNLKPKWIWIFYVYFLCTTYTLATLPFRLEQCLNKTCFHSSLNFFLLCSLLLLLYSLSYFYSTIVAYRATFCNPFGKLWSWLFRKLLIKFLSLAHTTPNWSIV